MNTDTRLPGYRLSKSHIAAFEQCPKKLWLQVHRREIAERDGDAKSRVDAGNAVGTIACALKPQGIMIEAKPDLASALHETSRLVAGGHPGPIFEATFEHENVLVRVDMIERDGNAWHAAEVKSSTGVKSHHHGDLATQIWVMRGAGLQISRASLRHVDRSYVLTKASDYAGLLTDAPMLDLLAALVDARGEEDRDNGSAQELAAMHPEATYVEVAGTHMSSVTKPDLGEAFAEWLGTA